MEAFAKDKKLGTKKQLERHIKTPPLQSESLKFS